MIRFLLLLQLVYTAFGLNITAPIAGQSWNVAQPLLVSWTTPVAGDPSNFSILMMKPGSSDYVVLAVNTDASLTRLRVSVPAGQETGDGAGFVIAFVQPPSTYYAVSPSISVTNSAALDTPERDAMASATPSTTSRANARNAALSSSSSAAPNVTAKVGAALSAAAPATISSPPLLSSSTTSDATHIAVNLILLVTIACLGVLVV